MRDTAGVIADPLYVGLTRPALALGVPYAALLANAFLTLELFLLSRNLLCVLLCVPLHGIAWLLCLAEPRYFELLAVRWQIRACAYGGQDPRWRVRGTGPFAEWADAATEPVIVVEAQP